MSSSSDVGFTFPGVELNSFESALRKLLNRKIDDVMQKNALDIIGGGAYVPGDVNGTAQKYSHAMGYQRALRDVLSWVGELEDDLQKT